MNDNKIKVTTIVNSPIENVWECWSAPEHIEKWAFASDDWMASDATNDLRVDGKFKTTMSAKDKSASFEFGGVYTAVELNKLIEYDMDDDRHVKTTFEKTPDGVKVTQTFDPEDENPEEMQRDGWQSILDNFKKYTEEVKANE